MLSDVALSQSSTTDQSIQTGETLFVTLWRLMIPGSLISYAGRCRRNDHRCDRLLANTETNEQDSSEEKIEALTETICRAGDEPAAALLVIFATLENANHPKALANMAKHSVFTRCGELNLYGMVDAQIAVLESELLMRETRAT